MKSILVIFLFAVLGFTSCKTATTSEKTSSFKVWGNCEKCKKTIEGACAIDGIKEKDWNIESKLFTVKYDTTKISLDEIQQMIAKVGYDNENYFGDDYAYAKLESCCQYERKPFEMK